MPSAPIELILRGENARQKTQFFGQIFNKSAQTSFLACFFFKHFDKTVCIVFLERLENQVDQPKKKDPQNFNFFFRNPKLLAGSSDIIGWFLSASCFVQT